MEVKYFGTEVRLDVTEYQELCQILERNVFSHRREQLKVVPGNIQITANRY